MMQRSESALDRGEQVMALPQTAIECGLPATEMIQHPEARPGFVVERTIWGHMYYCRFWEPTNDLGGLAVGRSEMIWDGYLVPYKSMPDEMVERMLWWLRRLEVPDDEWLHVFDEALAMDMGDSR